MSQSILIADIGGTKTDLALCSLTGKPKLEKQKRYINSNFVSPAALVDAYFSETDASPQYACFAVAGPTGLRVSKLTNLSWTIDAAELEKRFAIERLVMINDLTALSYAIPSLEDSVLFTIKEGQKVADSPCAVVAPGTGLGEGLVWQSGKTLLARGSEGGHTDFGPVNETQAKLLFWTQKQMAHVSYEAFLCGSGIARLYRFVNTELKIETLPEVASNMKRLTDIAPAVVEGALESGCPACKKSIDLFLEILGSEAGNLALKLLSSGGVFIGGGILPRFYQKVSFDGFLRGFLEKGKMSGLMEGFPIQLVLTGDTNIRGASAYARQVFPL